MSAPARFLAVLLGTCAVFAPAMTTAQDSPVLERLQRDARSLEPLVDSDLARRFLQAAGSLPRVSSPRVVHYNKDTRDALSAAEAQAHADLEGYERLELDEDYYYNTRYGTPLAFVRALDLVAAAGLSTVEGARIADFGFGSIGQLRLLASLGAHAVGIEVDERLRVLYGHEGDTGAIPPASVSHAQAPGSIMLHFGHFPSTRDMVDAVGQGYTLFVSKNTLKRGYIHPAQDVDPRLLVHLGVDEATFVGRMFDMLLPGGHAMIYNLHPAAAPEGEPYIPWADGRCPFGRDVLEKAGFIVVAFDRDDTPFARSMGKALGWGEAMDLQQDLFATWTLLQRPLH